MARDADPQGHKHAAKLLDGLLRTREGKAEGLFEVDPAALGLTATGADADDWRPEDPIDDLFVALKPYAPPPVLESAAPTTTTQRIVIKGGKTRAGLLAALGHLAIDLRYDERSARVQFLDATADFPKWINSDDMYRAELRERIADKFLYVTKDGQAPLAFSKDRFSDVIDALLNSRRIDPFKEWLDALPEWDGEKRLDFWLTRCFQIGDISPGLLRWASFSVLMGAVARTYTPGEKHDEMVILVGPQSLGKSTVWAWLLPPADRRSWFSDALKFHSARAAAPWPSSTCLPCRPFYAGPLPTATVDFFRHLRGFRRPRIHPSGTGRAMLCYKYHNFPFVLRRLHISPSQVHFTGFFIENISKRLSRHGPEA